MEKQVLIIKRHKIIIWAVGLLLVAIGFIAIFASIPGIIPRIGLIVMGLVGVYVIIYNPVITIILDKKLNKFIFNKFSIISRRREEMSLSDIKSFRFYKRMRSNSFDKYSSKGEAVLYIPVFLLKDNTELHISPDLPIMSRSRAIKFKDKITSFLDIPYDGIL
jgi:hypothetical protein